MRAVKTAFLGIVASVIWPLYCVLGAFAFRAGPWPRSLGTLGSALFWALALLLLVLELVRLATRPAGLLVHHLDLPLPVARQLGRAGSFLAVTAGLLITPAYLLDHGLLAPDDRAISAPTLSRMLVIGYEIVVWCACVRLLRPHSALIAWLDSMTRLAATEQNQSTLARGLAWLGMRRQALGWFMLVAIAAVAALEIRGYSFTARRLAFGGIETGAVIALAFALQHALKRTIAEHAWRFTSPQRSWARALSTAVALSGAARARGPFSTSELLVTPGESDSSSEESGDDVLLGLNRLAAGFSGLCALAAVAWVWDFNAALARFLLDQPLWSIDDQTSVTVGNVVQATIVMLIGATLWRYMNTLFTLTIFRRIPDDPGVRFAIVTLCRYVVLGFASIIALGAVHLDMARIGVVLAALGVGLGFGLQEVVSNFICGIILLLERPIRIGDVVTVGGTSGKVDRINIRATTIINADNQCMIVPNREFITGNLVNWTHKDKIVRVPLKLGVAYGNDPDRIVALLLSIAQADPDVLATPAAAAHLDEFGDFALIFSLSVYVAEPGLASKTKHRLFKAIQERFELENINMPFPTHEVHVSRVPHDLTQALSAPGRHNLGNHRPDVANRTPPHPHVLVSSTQAVMASPSEGGMPGDWADPASEERPLG